MQIAAQLAEIGAKMQQNGYVAATDGNISRRVDDNSILISISGKRKDSLGESDFVRISLSGEVLGGEGKPSTEYKLHTIIYKHRRDVNAVIHAHPKNCLVFAAGHFSLDVPVLPEVILTIGRIPLCEYATPSTNALAESLLPYIEYANVFLLRNHGVVTTGKTIEEAYNRLEKLEHYAETMAMLYTQGGPMKLTKKALKELYHAAGETYGITLHEKNRF